MCGKHAVMLRVALGFERHTEEVEDRPAVLITLPLTVLPKGICTAGGGEDQRSAAICISEVERIESAISVNFSSDVG